MNNDRLVVVEFTFSLRRLDTGRYRSIYYTPFHLDGRPLLDY